EGLVRLLPARRVQQDLLLPARSRLAAGHALAAPQTRQRAPGALEVHPPPLLRGRMVATRWRSKDLQPCQGAHHALPLPGNDNPLAMAQHCVRTPQPSGTCGEPAARRRARPVRRAGQGNGPGETPEPRPGPTLQRATGRDAAPRQRRVQYRADHITVLGEAIAALPPKYRRRLMVTCDGAGASHDLIACLDKL